MMHKRGELTQTTHFDDIEDTSYLVFFLDISLNQVYQYVVWIGSVLHGDHIRYLNLTKVKVQKSYMWW